MIKTGAAGYLAWLKKAQPALYAAVAPQIVRQVPGIFSGYLQTKAAGLAALSQDDDSVDVDLDDVDMFDASDLDTDLEATDADLDTGVESIDDLDLSDAADTTATDPSDLGALLNITTSAAQGMAGDASDFLTDNQLALQNAGAGLPALDTAGGSLLADVQSSPGLWVAGAGAVLLLLAMSARR